jgi:hypothetical protein
MLPKGKDEVRKGLLQSIVALNNNPDFEAVMEYLDEAGHYCAAQACVQQDDSLAKKCAGGFITLHEFKKLVEGADEELERLKGRKK